MFSGRQGLGDQVLELNNSVARSISTKIECFRYIFPW
jgi:hypothetical protein